VAWLALTFVALAFGLGEAPAPAYTVVLGIAQDGGAPQAGGGTHAGGVGFERHAACLAIVDSASGQRWMIDCTPSLPTQLRMLDTVAPNTSGNVLDGVFLTHAHIGHYTGLMYFGHEVMGTKGVKVYAMPRMQVFLRQNGPWDQLVRYENISLVDLAAGRVVELSDRLKVEAFEVPHRQEYSEVVGYHISGPTRSVLFIPDIDSWEEWDDAGIRIEDWIRRVDVAYLDGTFFADGEIAGRDMSGFPHPFISHSMERFARLPDADKAKIRFIHLNHTNPALLPGSEAQRSIEVRGFALAEELERVEL